ncbi:MAG: DUF3450 domain-containing protein [Pseudomonadota bacterium]|nr:DUF3450 domain-containing protein [Pseudomonadota bacterium]
MAIMNLCWTIRAKPLTRILVFWLGYSAGAWCVEPLEKVIGANVRQNRDAASSQQTIDRLDDETRRMLQEFRQNTRQAEALKTYNDYLVRMIESQQKEKKSIEKQLKEIEVTQREMVPLMLSMLESLEQFVAYDLPFLPEERGERISDLQAAMVRADVTSAEKFRRVLEAYQVEGDYGRTIEAYRANLSIDGVERPVDFLRLGRIALFYQTLDGSQTGMLNQESNSWEELPDEYDLPVRDGLRVARKEAAPNLLALPVPAPEEVQ